MKIKNLKAHCYLACFALSSFAATAAPGTETDENAFTFLKKIKLMLSSADTLMYFVAALAGSLVILFGMWKAYKAATKQNANDETHTWGKALMIMFVGFLFLAFGTIKIIGQNTVTTTADSNESEVLEID